MSETNGMEKKHASFAPETTRDTRLLILGSLPGAVSLAAQAYYAHPRNHFWRIMGMLLDEENFAARSYAWRLRILKKNRIGLWDVVAQAEREGSLDQNLKNITENPLTELIETLPNLRAIAFNGNTATRIGMRQLKTLGDYAPVCLSLPSTSPANTMPFSEKLTMWQAVCLYL
ncbi:MAG: DNA-deoxyinosine glycosylase [Burkholderiales bacterium]|nr:DNA-deoxyinosine glycosylase [Burkholderiales bacterium]